MAKRNKPAGAKSPASAGSSMKPKNSNDKNRSNKVSKDGMRSASTVKRLAMYNTKAQRNKAGKIISYELQSRELPNTRIVPDRRWFGNTRVVGQKQLEAFRAEMAVKVADPYAVIMDAKRLPMSLVVDPEAVSGAAGRAARAASRAALVATQPFAATFGKGAQRKRPRLAAESLEGLAARADDATAVHALGAPAAVLSAMGGDLEVLDARGGGKGAVAAAAAAVGAPRPAARDSVFMKGQSKRIWGELYKVLDSSDVVIQVLDARDPMGTRSRFLEKALKARSAHKQLILLLNKCDLVPAWATRRWLAVLSREYPTLAFHASVTNPFGKGALLGLLRQLARMRSDKQHVSVGLVGYPNVGKSSVVNALRSKRVTAVAPVPGQTKVWQYVTLTKKIFLIDCPGVVHASTTDSDTDAVLKGVVRVETLEDATEHVQQVLDRVKPEYLRRAYRLRSWTSAEDFLEQLARVSGRLSRGAEPDLNTTAKMVLLDWQRGKIPFFTLPDDAAVDRAVAEAEAEAAEAAAAGADEDGEDASGSEEDEPAEDDADKASGKEGRRKAKDGSDSDSDDAPTAPKRRRKLGAAAREAPEEVDPVRAAAASKTLADQARTVARRQARGDIPVQQGFYSRQDELGAAADGHDSDAVSGSSEEGSGDEASDDDASSADDAAAGSPAEDAADSDSDSDDGYGDDGLSWEAVMQTMQGGAPAAKPKK